MDYSLNDVELQINKVAKQIKKKYRGIYGVPKNGLIVATFLSKRLNVPIIDSEIKLLDSRDVLVVDDLIDSGKTIDKYRSYDCLVLVSKKKKEELPKNIKYVGVYLKPETWVNWFWENVDHDKEQVVQRQLQQIGENSSREGLIDTPARVVRSYGKLYGGYVQNPDDILKTTFSSCYDEVILLRNISLFSTCEHHLLPFTGKCHIAYIPGKCGKVVGISKLARLMEVYARRMQIQEKLTIEIGEALVKKLKPKGVAIIIEASHLCMVARGVEKQGSSMVTSYMYGAFKKNQSTRSELFSLIKL